MQEEKEAREAEAAAKKEAEEEAKAKAAAEKEENADPAAAEEKPVEPEEDDARMTKEQLSELAEALNILTAKSSIVKERQELQALLEDNMLSEAVSLSYAPEVSWR